MNKQQEGIVLAVNGKMAKVKASRHSDCENCGSCPGNTAIVVEALNSVDAKPGQRVAIEIREVNMLKAAFIVYMAPLLAAFAGALAGTYASSYIGMNSLIASIVGGVVFFTLAVWYVKHFDHMARNDERMRPVVASILSK
ncbi:SoxR reducing system RseC family protein [Sporomusa acidovorans]|uniref:SoxR reducing system RseC family protein n=1 Tax=Sporomusa acidovorans TaxID=112900 RepID=UPI00088CB563|nr:SoxR reducing system RseC family protein [Sporomusa acidovorans]OZC18995.1 SoxR reducing system protein RseC [Sporomusa acidovorans DSM 3132]SDD72409.1 positive regulator of sigma(E), RseC/MucC [Sporomusa acidovorans]